MKQAFEKEGIKGANSVDKTEQKVADLVKVGRSAAAKSQGASKGLKRKLEPEHKVLTETKNHIGTEPHFVPVGDTRNVKGGQKQQS